MSILKQQMTVATVYNYIFLFKNNELTVKRKRLIVDYNEVIKYGRDDEIDRKAQWALWIWLPQTVFHNTHKLIPYSGSTSKIDIVLLGQFCFIDVS